MKNTLMMLVALFVSTQVFAINGSNECLRFENDAVKVEAIQFTADLLNYDSVEAFCTADRLWDLQVSHAPNFWPVGEEEDHHVKLMLHYEYHSCTIYYNQTQKKLSRQRCYNTW
ncbi:hypothetical protein ABMA79_02765 [Halobacteriovorax sp. HFRX-2_2]|uniref:hypothetical protein n=1 Tax=unclassified Halobacteriovorax TaxID=2639665 RepID=UPI00371702CD